MTLVIQNEKATPYIFDASRGGKTVLAGEVVVLSDDEWDSVVFSQRGPGKLNPLWPTQATSETLKLNFDHFVVGTSNEILYLGSAPQNVSDSEDKWVIKKFAYTTVGSEVLISQIQTLQDVAWDDRTTLPWT